jgi:F0F1-type ATP synthase assembly protein I
MAFLTLGLGTALCLAAGFGLGLLVDRWLGISPWGAVVGVVAGIVMAILMAVTKIRQYLR